MEESFVCPICGNRDFRKFGIKNGKYYCRACLSFNGEKVKTSERKSLKVDSVLPYSLSKRQEDVSNKVLKNYKNGINTLIYAVCGAGKTELTFEVMKYALNEGHQIGFCIPRKDVVIELTSRIKSFFPDVKVTAIYGGHTSQLKGDIICLTSHQLYRFVSYFDLLIMDEIDAFPFKKNNALNHFFFNSIKGNYVVLSATPSLKTIEYFKKENRDIVTLFNRFHNHALPVPYVIKSYSFLKVIKTISLLRKYQKQNKPVLVFAPTIQVCESLYKWLKTFVRNGEYVHSKKGDRDSIISKFKNNVYDFLVTTSVLERGVTISNLQVIVYDADSFIYDRYSLVQISGRAGRKSSHPFGDVTFIVSRINEEVKNAIEDIKNANANLQGLF